MTMKSYIQMYMKLNIQMNKQIRNKKKIFKVLSLITKHVQLQMILSFSAGQLTKIPLLKKFGVIDSKKLTAKKKIIFNKIISLSSDYGIGQSLNREIDKFGIRVAIELS